MRRGHRLRLPAVRSNQIGLGESRVKRRCLATGSTAVVVAWLGACSSSTPMRKVAAEAGVEAPPAASDSGAAPASDGSPAGVDALVVIDVAATLDVAPDGVDAQPWPDLAIEARATDSGSDRTCGDLQSDPLNCGFCGHDCLGGECLAGKCQPAIVAGGLNATAYVENLDDQHLYFSTCSADFTLCDVWMIAKSARSGTPTLITSGSYFAVGVIGPRLLLHSAVQGKDELECDLSSGCAAYVSLPNGGALCSFKSPSPTYIPMWNASNGIWKVSWFGTDHSFIASYSEAMPASATYRTMFATGDAIYWIRGEPGAGGASKHTLFGIHASDVATTKLAGSLTEAMNIMDVNSRSILLRDGQAIYRVPAGGASAPQQLASPSGYGVEDETRVYWMDDADTLYQCQVSDCASTKTVMASGYPSSSPPSQDAVALYWGTGSPNQILRLAK